MIAELEKLRVKKENLILYNAGLPSFPKVFIRDSIVSALLMRDVGMLRDVLLFSLKSQGKKNDKHSGEEPGKIAHEVPPTEIKGLSTKYNACDTTALFLIGSKEYVKKTRDWGFVMQYAGELRDAADYILSHLRKGLFYDDPSFSGGERFALKVTYWKDSEVVLRKGGHPIYPVCYSLAHIQNMAGLRAAAFLLKDDGLMKKAEEMKSHLSDLFDKDVGFVIAKDKKGPIKVISSDTLHALFYLGKEDLTKNDLKTIVKVSRVLESSLGYMALDPHKIDLCKNNSHCAALWPYEQALIHEGARKFGLNNIKKVSERIKRSLRGNPEFFSTDKKGSKFKDSGNDLQLWTIAAKKYFGLYE